jgi:biotin transport system substrate-specific component
LSTLAHPVPRARGGLAADVALVFLGSLAVAGLAQLSVRLPFTPVPITGQTLGVLAVGAALGARRGAAALFVYLAEGAAGLPVFAEGRSGIAYLVSADPLHTTGGYLWGFVAAAFVVGLLVQRGWDRSVGSALGAMLLGEIVIFTCGVLWLSVALDVPIQAPGSGFNDALEFGLYPFVVGDVLKLLLGAALVAMRRRLTTRPTGQLPRRRT